MNTQFLEKILECTGASSCKENVTIQELWSGYGRIVRIGLAESIYKSVVVKYVQLPNKTNHPRGWNTNLSHERKVKSYQVEVEWYKHFSSLSNDSCRVPKCLGFDELGDEVLIVMEDLDELGFDKRLSSVSLKELYNCIEWLANFHATYLGVKPNGLWEKGTYWHLETRPEELDVLADTKLKTAAAAIDKVLNETVYQTLVHGDAKLANFCFSEAGDVSAVDFQYIGGGCGMKDLVYFVGSCLGETDCEKYEKQILDHYFKVLRGALKQSDFSGDEIEKDWRPLYHIAWADFHRFLKGWSPGHWKINSYSERVTKQVIENLN